ncbi:MAG: gamma-butyrobetaine hydroxylase-like domain-containing protein [Rhodopila sp.]|jgi:DUF971 family protein
MPQPTEIRPTEIRLDRAARVLHVSFDDGKDFALPAEYLRVESPSAEVQGHSPDQKQTVAGRRLVGITAIEPVGHYAIRLIFDDRHDSGIYSWDYLRRLGEEYDQRWPAYLDELAARGLSRDPA